MMEENCNQIHIYSVLAAGSLRPAAGRHAAAAAGPVSRLSPHRPAHRSSAAGTTPPSASAARLPAQAPGVAPD